MSKRWYIRFPGAFYAEGPITLRDEDSKEVHTTSQPRARQCIRRFLSIERLPGGFECWPTNE